MGFTDFLSKVAEALTEVAKVNEKLTQQKEQSARLQTQIDALTDKLEDSRERIIRLEEFRARVEPFLHPRPIPVDAVPVRPQIAGSTSDDSPAETPEVE